MLDFSITHVGAYRHPEKYVQTVTGVWIVLYVSGVKYARRYLPDGRLIKEDKPGSAPYFSLALPGMKTDFEFTDKRENWVVMLKDFPVRESQDPSCAEIDFGGSWLRIPYFTDVGREFLPVWQREMMELQMAFKTPTPLSVCKAKLCVMGMLRFMLGGLAETGGGSPEETLKRLIDEDVSFSKGISELGAGCNVSPDHLRMLFQRRYQINPLAYRIQRRNAFIMELMANSALSIKEIAARTGFKHVSHFCVEFQRQFGVTPKEGLRRFRYLRNEKPGGSPPSGEGL